MFACRKCNIDLPSREELKNHWGSQFHKYNTLRACENLPCVDEDQYKLFYEDFCWQNDIDEDLDQYECHACKKTFNSQGTYSTHLNSKTHRRNLERVNDFGMREEQMRLSGSGKEDQDTGSDLEDFDVISMASDGEVQEDEEDGLTRCLICDEIADDAESCFEHMLVTHSLLVPYIQYCTNLEELYRILAEKVFKRNCCLKCDKEHQSYKACRQHMLSKPHLTVKVNDPDLLEYFSFDDMALSIQLVASQDYDGELLVQELQLPESDRVLIPRQLVKYAKQNLSARPSVAPSRVAIKENSRRLAITGGNCGAIRDANGDSRARVAGHDRRTATGLAVSVKANKMQHHFREQI